MGIQEDMVLRGPWRVHAEQVFNDPDDAGGLFNTDALRRGWKDFLAGREIAQRIAKLFAMQVWLRECSASIH
jgi:hypothetical protein